MGAESRARALASRSRAPTRARGEIHKVRQTGARPLVSKCDHTRRVATSHADADRTAQNVDGLQRAGDALTVLC